VYLTLRAQDELSAAERHHGGVLPGAAAFRLLSARGIPLDVVRDECVRRGVAVDEPALAALLASEQDRCRAARAAGSAGTGAGAACMWQWGAGGG
jgi:alanyl-tRNA synthetase